MGGTNEQVMEKKTTSNDGTTQVNGQVRYHQAIGGFIHFHDDVNALKVSIPVATWFSAWQSWGYADLAQQTYLHVAVIVIQPENLGEAYKLDVSLAIEKMKLSPDFTKLKDFTTGQPK